MRIWTPQAMELMNEAREKAYAMGHAELDPLHLLWVFLQEATRPEGRAMRVPGSPGPAILRTELKLAELPRAIRTVVASPNSAFQELILRAADLAPSTAMVQGEGRIGPHELVLALVGDQGPAGDMLRNFEMRTARMAG
ncbi:MAG: hypothetical protein ABFS42_02590 [Candidatus Krumholzibacteriota bacterium]